MIQGGQVTLGLGHDFGWPALVFLVLLLVAARLYPGAGSVAKGTASRSTARLAGEGPCSGPLSAVGNQIAQGLSPMKPPDGVRQQSRDAHALNRDARRIRGYDAVRQQERVERELSK